MYLSFDQLLEFHEIKNLTVVFNKRLSKSWSLRTKPYNNRILTIPSVLKDAPESIKYTLIQWAELKKPFLRIYNSKYLKQKKHLEERIWSYLIKNGCSSYHKIRNPQKYIHKTQGTLYNLADIFVYLNITYFNTSLSSYIRWGNSFSKTSYQSWYEDDDGSLFSLITIAGIYNHPEIPEFAIYSIVYHEMLHIAIPPFYLNGKRIVHGREFKKSEKNFPFYTKWRQWQRTNLGLIIRKK